MTRAPVKFDKVHVQHIKTDNINGPKAIGRSCVNLKHPIRNQSDNKIITLPWKNSPPYGILDHHIHTEHRTETSLHHNRGSCDQETTLPDNRDSAHKSCSFCHRPVLQTSNN